MHIIYIYIMNTRIQCYLSSNSHQMSLTSLKLQFNTPRKRGTCMDISARVNASSGPWGLSNSLWSSAKQPSLHRQSYPAWIANAGLTIDPKPLAQLPFGDGRKPIHFWSHWGWFIIGTKPTNQLVAKRTLTLNLYHIITSIYHLLIPNPEKPLALSGSDFDLDLHQLPFPRMWTHVDTVLALQNL
jgi:hypothetical protein